MYAAALAGVPFSPLNYRLPAAQLADLAAGLGERPCMVMDEQYASAWTGSSRWCSTPAGTTAKPKGAVLRHSHLLSYVLGTVEFGSAAAEKEQIRDPSGDQGLRSRPAAQLAHPRGGRVPRRAPTHPDR
jgi:hypothetical protein